jgi:3-hydroxyacyl-[acyl-carrier-protein] dehydratase
MSEFSEAILSAGRGDTSVNKDGWFRRDFVFTEDFPGFSGHFPGRPVLPGIAQMVAGASLAAAWRGQMPEIHNVKNAKFLAPIHPGMTVTILARPLGQDAAEARVLLEDQTAATFILGFSKDT